MTYAGPQGGGPLSGGGGGGGGGSTERVVRVRLQAGTSILTGVATTLPLDTGSVLKDEGAVGTVGANGITLAGTGPHLQRVHLVLSNPNVLGQRSFFFRRNAANSLVPNSRQTSVSFNQEYHDAELVVDALQGDELGVQFFQSSGGTQVVLAGSWIEIEA